MRRMYTCTSVAHFGHVSAFVLKRDIEDLKDADKCMQANT